MEDSDLKRTVFSKRREVFSNVSQRFHLEDGAVKFQQSHQTFVANCKLSICVAVWVTLIGLPSYCHPVRELTFGKEGCREADLGKRVMVNGTMVAFDPLVHQENEMIWCGYVVNEYLKNWQNLIQMIIFTVYQNTGTTIMQAWQGLIGTFCAALNIFIMDTLSPEETASTGAWVDTLLFIFLVLVSGSEENTMKFAMSWHVFFMMTFLDPNSKNRHGKFPTGIPHLAWDQYTVVVLFTALIGVTVAVLATVFPPPALLNYKRVEEDAESAMQGVAKIWREAIDYFCSSAVSAKRFVIAEAINGLIDTGKRVEGNLANSWWETFDLCGFGKTRTLYNIFDTTLEKSRSVMVAVQDSVLTEDFGGEHEQFCSGLHESMSSLKTEAVELLEKCHTACRDGDIDSDEAEEIEEAIDSVKASQLQMLEKYRQVSQGEKASGECFVSKSLSNENEFVFALSVWARKITDCADTMLRTDADLDDKQNSCGATLFATVKNGLIHTWRPPTKAKLIWALRNFLPITFAFWLGYSLPSCPMKDCSEEHIKASVFTPYDANMANTLGLLINHYPGSALVNNIMRLLGVTLGKVVPMVIIGGLNILPYGSPSQMIGTGVTLFVFTWLTNYMYYASKHWSNVGCLMAGFGCAILISPMEDKAMVDYTPNYKEIAQVVTAIMIQILIDGVVDWIQDGWPRDMAVKKIGALKDTLLRAFTAFFDGDVEELLAATAEAEGLLEEARALTHEADPQTDLVQGVRTDFKVNLYSASLKQVEMLCSDLTMLTLAVRAWHVDAPPKDGNDKTARENHGHEDQEEDTGSYTEFSPLEYMHGLDCVHGPHGLKEELLCALEMVLSSLEAMLGYGSEDNNFQDIEQTRELVNMNIGDFSRQVQLYEEINSKGFTSYSRETQVCEDPRVKVTVAVRSLERAKAHVGKIEKLMMPYIML